MGTETRSTGQRGADVELPPNPASVYGCDPHTYPRRSAWTA